MDLAVVKAESLEKTYCDFWRRPVVRALENFSFSVNRGEVFGLLGPNGSGKSTTIKLLLGLVRPTSGRISLFGRDPASPEARRRIGYLPEVTNLHKFLTPRETILYYAGLFSLERKTARQRCGELLEMLGLEDVADRQISSFSKGMARKVALAQALVNNPDLVILDEPTSGLDPIATSAVKEWISSLAAAGKTVLMTSHLLADVQDVASHIAILNRGRLCKAGAVDSLLPDGRGAYAVASLESLFLDAVGSHGTRPLAPFLSGGRADA